MASIGSGLRLACRQLWRRKLFSALLIATLGLGLGANSAVFSFLYGLVLQPLPYERPEQLVFVRAVDGAASGEMGPASMADFLDWREQAQSFQGTAVLGFAGFTLGGGKEPETLRTALVTPGMLGLLGARPLHGRTFLAEEEVAGNDRVVVLSYGLWQRRFGADPEIVGRSMLLEGAEHLVVGVLPRGFNFLDQDVELWNPLAYDRDQRAVLRRNRRLFEVVARLQDGVTLEVAQQEMSAIAARLEEAHGRTNRGWGVQLVALQEHLRGNLRAPLWVLMAASLCVLLIACGNGVALLLARGREREQEEAVRRALGAGSWSLLRHSMLETLLLAAAGGVAGLVLSYWATRWLLQRQPAGLPQLAEAGGGAVSLLFLLALVVLCALLLSALPVLLCLRRAPWSTLRGTGGGGARALGGWLILAQLACSLALLAVSGLLLHSLIELRQRDPGFEQLDVLAAQISLPRSRYPWPLQHGQFFAGLLEQLSASPEVELAAATSALPLSRLGVDFAHPFSVVEQAKEASDAHREAQVRMVSPDLVSTLGLRLLQGRSLLASDHAEAPRVAMVNETFLRRFGLQDQPLGKHLEISLPYLNSYEIVGVLADVRHYGLARPARPEIFLCSLQAPLPVMTVLLRAQGGDSARLLPVLRSALREADSKLPLGQVTEVGRELDRSLGSRRFSLLVLTLLAGLALLLALSGIYGLVSYWTGQRRRELGVRLALGADRWAVLRAGIRPSLPWIVGGVVLGLPLAAILAALLRSRLHGLESVSPTVLLICASMLALMAVLSGLLAATRALRVDPARALRQD